MLAFLRWLLLKLTTPKNRRNSQRKQQYTYTLLSVVREKNTLLLKIQKKTARRAVQIPATVFFSAYQSYLEQFSPHDIAAITAASGEYHNILLIEQPSLESKRHFDLLLALQIGFLFAANVMSAKMMHIFSTDIVAGALCFPLTYSITDIITELYGKAYANRALSITLLTNIMIILLIELAIAMPAAPHWKNQQAYELVLHSSAQVFLASALSFYIGDQINIALLSKLSRIFNGAFLWPRLFCSSLLGLSIDSFIFIFLAKSGQHSIPFLWHLSLSVCLHKMIYEFIACTLIAWLINYLKSKRNGVDRNYAVELS